METTLSVFFFLLLADRVKGSVDRLHTSVCKQTISQFWRMVMVKGVFDLRVIVVVFFLSRVGETNGEKENGDFWSQCKSSSHGSKLT